MIDLHRILVPTDFSKFSQHALTYAAAFAEKFGADLYLLHVVQNLALVIPEVIPVEPPLTPSVEQLTTAVQSAFDRVIAAGGGVTEMSSRVNTEGMTYDQYRQRQAEMMTRLLAGLPARALDSPLRAELTRDDVPGFLERLGYHNDADPFLEQRFAF